MKTIFVIILVLCLLTGANARATTLTQDGTANTTITTTVGESYSITIPATVPVTFNALATSFTLSVASLQLNAGKALRVSATPGNALQMVGDSSKTIAYALMHDSSAFSFIDFNTVADKTLTVEITQAAWNSADAGTYSGTVTFNVAIVDTP